MGAFNPCASRGMSAERAVQEGARIAVVARRTPKKTPGTHAARQWVPGVAINAPDGFPRIIAHVMRCLALF